MAYTNTFITVADDCPLTQSEVPTSKREKMPAHMVHYKLLTSRPYYYGHEDLIFEQYLYKESIDPNIAGSEREKLWNALFSKEHPCLRASALTKRYGFGAHYNESGKIALYPMESAEYRAFLEDDTQKKRPAMKTKR